MRFAHCRSLPALLLVAGMALGPPLANPARAVDRPRSPLPATTCEIGLPISIDLDVAGAPPQAGARTDLSGVVTTRDPMAAARVRLEAYGNVRLVGSDVLELGPLASGETRPFTVAVDYTGDGDGAVHAWIEADPADGSRALRRRGSLFSAIDRGQTLTGKASALDLKFRAIDASAASGKFSTLQATTARAALTQMEAVRVADDDITPPTFPTPIRQSLNELVGAPAMGRAAEFKIGDGGPSINGGITVQGQIRWQDQNGNPHPAYGIDVHVYEENAIFDILLGSQNTGTDGMYSINTANADTDNGIPDIYVSVDCTNSWIDLQPDGGGEYTATGPTDTDNGNATITYNLTLTNGGPSAGAFSVFQAAVWIAAYTSYRHGSALPQIVTYWPDGDTRSFYDGDLNIEQADRWDWDTIHHEYGHYTTDELDTEDNPGGQHNIGDCISVVSDHDKDEGVRLAWGEGWPTFNGTSAQIELGLTAENIPRVGDTQYDDQEDDGVNYDLEVQDSNGMGEDNELAVQRMLYDAWDSASDGRDNLSLGVQFLWDVIDNANPVTLSAAWNALYANSDGLTDLELSEIACDHQVGPSLQAPAEGTIINTLAQANFSWDKDVGCSTTYDGDLFDLVFVSHLTGDAILIKPLLTGTSYALTQGELDLLRNNNHFAYWAVKGYNTDSPGTGPYLGESFLLTFNTPPEADAGPDQTVECTSPTVTAVQLDGTGTTDADGDVLVYTWMAPGVSFDNANSHTPIGQFPHGTTIVTLKVTDGFQEDTDTVEITVEDTTPPVVTCPDPVTIECNDHCEGGGVPKDDAQLSAFFDGVSAVDICDSAPEITDNAPDCFPVGVTDVIFTAKDSHNNAASCTTQVEVVDTTPPEIVMTLNRDALWPPNHKLADVEATVEVTDICDPNPTFVLTSITSDEPDNGLGDGDTPNDIQDATIGEPDTAFRLRAERAGNQDGRTYTIIYTASDISGNTASDTARVYVPHDRRGGAHAAGGFAPSGQALDPNAIEFQLVLLGTAAVPGDGVDGAATGVGNSFGGFRPRRFVHRDVNADQTVDLILWFDVKATLALRQLSTKKDPIGLHYWGPDGSGYLVDDIFKLGIPLTLLSVTDAGDRELERPDEDSNLGDRPLGGTTGDIAGFDLNGSLVLTEPGPVTIELFDVTGRRVRTVFAGDMGKGANDVSWDGRDDAGREVSAGLYFYRALTAAGSFHRKVLVRP